MLDQLGYVSSKNLSAIKLLDPAVGSGAFFLNALERLFASSKEFKFDFVKSLRNLTAVELDRDVSENLKNVLQEYLTDKEILIDIKTLEQMIVTNDFLLTGSGEIHNEYDIIIGNPPYIRHEQIPDGKKILYRNLFETFRHRSDIYIGFYEKALKLLSKNGQLSFICSNRWMKTKYGQNLRDLISTHYSLDAIIDINDKQAFDQDVDAYASITLISNQFNDGFYHYAAIDNIKSLNILDYTKASSSYIRSPVNGNWNIGDDKSFHIADHYTSIEQQGYKLGIGVASGADKIFIGKDLPIEESLLVPIITAREIMNGNITWKGRYIFNPYAELGGLVDLKKYPKAKQYLEEHSDVLRARHTAKKSNAASWYKTIDRIYPELTKQPKLLIPDMKRDGLFPIDDGRFYPHHNIYYITHSHIKYLKLLGAFLISDFCKEQINLVSVKMRGGFSRWQSQNLRKILLPEIVLIDKQVQDSLITAYESKDILAVNKLINEITQQK